MSAALQRVLMTRDEFLAWDEAQELRYEYDGYGPVAMTGGTLGHSIIKMNLYRELSARLRRTGCQPFDSDVRIDVAGSIRYPDAMVSCSPVDPKATWGPEPVVVFEVLSAGTAATDTRAKNAEYRDTPSIRRYVMLDQDQIGGMMFVRRADEWLGSLLAGADTALDIPEIGVSLRLGDLYEGVALEPAAPPA